VLAEEFGEFLEREDAAVEAGEVASDLFAALLRLGGMEDSDGGGGERRIRH
jgi:hypothetical protein